MHAHTYTNWNLAAATLAAVSVRRAATFSLLAVSLSVNSRNGRWFFFVYIFYFWSRLVNATTWSALAQANLTHTHTVGWTDSHIHTHLHTHVHAQTHERWNCTKILETRRARPATSLLCARLPLPNNTNIERELRRRFATSVSQKEAQPHAIASARALRVFREVARHESDGTLAPSGRGANSLWR